MLFRSAAQDLDRIKKVERLARRHKLPFMKISSVTNDGITRLKRAMADRLFPVEGEEAATESTAG